jgi:hypothetical protein
MGFTKDAKHPERSQWMPDDKNPAIKWAPRIAPEVIRRLYREDASGVVRPELIDDVGYALLMRCETIQRVTERLCPKCGSPMDGVFASEVRTRAIKCTGCGFQTTWEHYHRSYKKDRVHGGRAYPWFLDYLKAFPTCRTPQEKMVCIDRLIHATHGALEDIYTKPAAENLIRGKWQEIKAVLDDLAYGDVKGTARDGIREAFLEKMRVTQEGNARQEEERKKERG